MVHQTSIYAQPYTLNINTKIQQISDYTKLVKHYANENVKNI